MLKNDQTANGYIDGTKEILDTWNLSDQYSLNIEDRWIKYFISDTTNTMPKFIKKLNFIWVPCAAHLMNLVITDTFKKVKFFYFKNTNFLKIRRSCVQCY